MSSPLHLPPLDGSLTVLPGFLDFHAEYNPDRPWAVYPWSGDVGSISFSELAKATHRLAHFLRPDASIQSRDIAVVLVNCDTVLYATVLMGIARAGMVPFPVSHRNSPEAITHLLRKSSCYRVLTQTSLKHLLSNAETAFSAEGLTLQIDELPELSKVYPKFAVGNGIAHDAKEALYPALPRPGNDELAMFIHSSGSTGFPKPIPLTQKIITQWVKNPMFVDGRRYRASWGSMALPTFHSMGILTQLMAPLIAGEPVGLYEPKSPAPPVVPSPQNLLDALRITGCNAVMTVPSFVEIWAESEETVKFLASLSMVVSIFLIHMLLLSARLIAAKFFGGGPLSAENGNKLVAAGVRLVSGYGATEAGPVAHPFDGFDADPSNPDAKTPEDWAWSRMPPLTSPRWVPQGDGTYELQFLTNENHQPSVENLPDAKGYATSDFIILSFSQYESSVGRKDDVIVLGSADLPIAGEKVVPIPQERYIASHPLIADVVMFGRGKSQVGILIDPVPEHAVSPGNKEEASKFIDEIWAYIEQANTEAPTFARIFKEMVVLTDPAKPLPRATKGNIVRNPALKLYAEEIEQLYETRESDLDLKTISCPEAWTPEGVESWLLDLTASVNHGASLQATLDIFEQGFDSLHATFLRNHIVNALRASEIPDIKTAAKLVDQNIVYANPTIQRLAAAVTSIVSTKAAGSHTAYQARLIEDFVVKYTANLPFVPQQAEVPKQNIIVFLTGSTGSVGSYLLASLLSDPRVAMVYAFNRPSKSSTNRQSASFEDRGLDSGLLNGIKYVPVTGDLSDDNFGLSKEVLEQIASSVTHVVHNGWRVDFNHALVSFESLIAGTRKLVDFCLSVGRPIRMLFTSSVGVANSWPGDRGLVPESPLSNPEFASDSGYSASKYVVEQILGKARVQGFEATSIRVGQVCGTDVSGAWNVTDWVPILVKSALTMGSVPDLNEPATWIPVDAVAGSFVDLMFSPRKLPVLVNLVHPRPVTWQQLVDAIGEELHVPISVLPMAEWLEKLEILAEDADPEVMDKVPAIKLLGFFRVTFSAQSSRPAFDTAKLQEFSDTMNTISPIGKQHAAMWIKTIFTPCGHVRSGGKTAVPGTNWRKWKVVFSNLFDTEMALATMSGMRVKDVEPPWHLSLTPSPLLDPCLPDDPILPMYIRNTDTGKPLQVADAQTLFIRFRTAGPLVSVHVNVDVGYESPACVLQFWDEEHAKYAKKSGAGIHPAFQEMHFTLQTYDPWNLYCCNLGSSIRSDTLRQEFAKFGSIIDTRVVRSGFPDAFGFISFKTREEAANAKRNLNWKTLDGRAISIRYHEPKSQAKIRPHPGARSSIMLFTTGEPSGHVPEFKSNGRPNSTFRPRPSTEELEKMKEKARARLQRSIAEGIEKKAKQMKEEALRQEEEKAKEVEQAEEAANEAEENLIQAKSAFEEATRLLNAAQARLTEAEQAAQQSTVDWERAIGELRLATENRRTAECEESQATQRREEAERKEREAGNDKSTSQDQAAYADQREEPEKEQDRTRAEEHDHQEEETEEEEARRHAAELEESRRKLEELRRQEETDKQEREAKRREAELAESRRRMAELEEEDRQRQREKKEAAEAAKRAKEERERLARQEEERKAREKREQKEREEDAARARLRAYYDAATREKHRCRTRDEALWRRTMPWNASKSVSRFKLVCKEFDEIKFSATQPLTFASVPWPTLHSPHEVTESDIEWQAVERFFQHLERVVDDSEYRTLVEKTHRRFHPDKWRSRGLLNTILDDITRKGIEDAGNIVAQALTPIWEKSRGK
ncbi:hypothetical protein NM688_g1689 [Phlebia brevispora]|uniref:Uncharacterized protein n=1 Tax=Phlebia brevispora TaxID=194682 RepID=A0ACC1TBE6_9APHY|nr:hypothetical protein NM688_g1689 [Phlebia brevispora]